MTPSQPARDWKERIATVVGSPADTRRTYDRIARWYDIIEAPFERRARAAELRILAAESGERVLEIGFGTGLGLVALARHVGGSGSVVGVDLSPRMADVARRRIWRLNLPTSPQLIEADARHLPLPDSSFDAVTMSFTLDLIPTDDIPGVLAQCRRVLRKSGRLAVLSLDLPPNPSRMTRVYLAAHRRWPHLVDCRPIPVAEVITSEGFTPIRRWSGAIFGIPVAAVSAKLASPPDG